MFFETPEVSQIQGGEERFPSNGVRCDHTIHMAAGASASAIEQVARQLRILFGERIDPAECFSGRLHLGFVKRAAEVF